MTRRKYGAFVIDERNDEVTYHFEPSFKGMIAGGAIGFRMGGPVGATIGSIVGALTGD